MKKRIALSVVAALTGGLLAAAPASAATSYSATTTLSTNAVTLQTGFDTTTVATFTTALASVAGGNLVSTAGANLDSVTVTLSDEIGSLVTNNLLSTSAGSAAYDTFTVASTETVTYESSGAIVIPQLAGSNGAVDKGASNEVHVIRAASDAATASATLNLVLRKNTAIAAGTYKVKLATQYLGAAGDTVTTSAPQYLTITVAPNTARTYTLSASTATVAAGANTSFTVKDAYTAVASDVTTLAISTASSYLTLGVTVGAASGGFAEATSASTSSVTITNTKNAIAGAFSATHTVNVAVAANTPAGTYTVTAGTSTFTITVSPAPYASTTIELADNGTGYYTGTTGDGVLYAPKTATTTRVGRVTITQLTATGAALTDATAAKSIKVTIAGAGSLADATGGLTTSEQIFLASSVAGAKTVDIFANGTAGTGTVTVYIDGVSAKTFTVKFYGAVAKLVATPIYTIGNAAGGTTGTFDTSDSRTVNNVALKGINVDNDAAIAVVATDANGTPVPVSSLTMSSTDPSVVAVNGFTARADAGTGLYTAGVFANHVTFTTAAGLSGKSTELKFTVVNADATSASTDAVKVTLGGAAKTVTVALDKATYTVGDLAVATVSAKDAAGNAAFDGQNAISAAGLVSNLNGGSVAKAVLSGGKAAVKLYAPVVAGTWVLAGKDLNGVAISASAAVTATADPAVTALTAKAASTEATVAALQVTVASIIKSLKVQWWLLKKIAVKVGIKLG